MYQVLADAAGEAMNWPSAFVAVGGMLTTLGVLWILFR